MVDPHKLTKTLMPPRGQSQSHVKAVFSLRSWVPPAEPIPLEVGRFLSTDTVYKLRRNPTGYVKYYGKLEFTADALRDMAPKNAEYTVNLPEIW